jgi:hypothetical protein
VNCRVNNFSKDVSDGENYTVLLSQLKPDQCDRAPLQQKELLKRAEMVLQRADSIGCRKYLTPGAMVAGNPKLNLAFVAHLFNTWPCLEALETPPPMEIEDFDAEGEREARVFTLWLNSLDVDPGVYNLFEDLKDGTVILQAFDKVVPGSVVWRRVTKPREGQEMSRFKQVENTNYAVDLAKSNHLHMVGIQGADIVDGTRTLTLGLVWQLMRLNITNTLQSINKGGRGVTDQDMIRWANEKVKANGKTSTMHQECHLLPRSARWPPERNRRLQLGHERLHRRRMPNECKIGHLHCEKAGSAHLLGPGRHCGASSTTDPHLCRKSHGDVGRESLIRGKIVGSAHKRESLARREKGL